MKIKDSVILITGSSDRVGKEIAFRLSSEGAKIIIHYNKNKEKAEETASEILSQGQTAKTIQGNLQYQKDWEKIKNEILNDFERIDVLINNAAIFYKTPLFTATESDWDSFINVNLKGVFLGSKIFGEIMFKQKGGKIINISDVAGETIWPDYIPYCVSKAGVFALTRGLAKALAPHVLVNCIAPGTVLLAEKYDQSEEQALIDSTPLQRVGTAEDMAATAAFLIEGSDFITGAVIKVDGGRSIA
jgi:NAD(P)-dependent dehydrogenase (short-subunit alcohol dehydrogenase family)